MIVIRRARHQDVVALLQLAKEFATSFVVDPDAFRIALDELLASASTYLAVAEEDEYLFGYILGFDHFTFYANGRVGWVEEVAVEEKWRRNGIGRALMDGFEGWAKTRGCKLIAVATRRAGGFYRALGYEESATYFRKLL